MDLRKLFFILNLSAQTFLEEKCLKLKRTEKKLTQNTTINWLLELKTL